MSLATEILYRSQLAERHFGEFSPGRQGHGHVERDRPYELVGVPVNEPPLIAVALEDLGDTQRPILLGQTVDLPILPLDIGEDDQVVGGDLLHELELGIAVPCE